LPGEASATVLLERGEVDAALVLGADPLPHLRGAAEAMWRRMPTIVLDDELTATARAATVAFRTATFGVETAGSVYRSDGVALPLKRVWQSPQPDAAQVLAQLAAQIPLTEAAAP
jgi:formylmethanofuran dehydrogenase subunit B